MRLAWTKSKPATKDETKEDLKVKPVRIIPSEMDGFRFTKAYVMAEPKEWLQHKCWRQS